ncbi:MAG: hypothetical protein ACYC0B_09815 [Gemmatimonadaceae bacterium]
MLRHSPRHRLVSLLGGAAFALLTLTSGVVRHCPMHATGMPDVAADAGDAHGAHHSVTASVPTSVPEQAPAHDCDCAATCCAAPVTAFLTTAPRLLARVAQVMEPVAQPATIAHVPVRAHALPFSIGPPGLASG